MIQYMVIDMDINHKKKCMIINMLLLLTFSHRIFFGCHGKKNSKSYEMEKK